MGFKRIDGESSGEVQFDHLVGVFATSDAGAVLRLNIETATPTSTDTATSRLVVKNGDGTDCTGAVTYETEYALMTEDSVYILDIGNEGSVMADTNGKEEDWEYASEDGEDYSWEYETDEEEAAAPETPKEPPKEEPKPVPKEEPKEAPTVERRSRAAVTAEREKEENEDIKEA